MRVGVVVRQLVLGAEKCDPAVSAVFRDPGDCDSLGSYFEDRLADHKKAFIEKFPEFRQATWSLTIMDVE